MRAVRLLEFAISLRPETVLDIAVGPGKHAVSFISNGSKVTGLDITEAKIEHSDYDHIQSPYETADIGDRQWDMIWCCHTLEHMSNVQHFLIHLYKWLKDDGWLAISVPTQRQNRMHIGHLTTWSPALLIYNLVCAGWDCRKARWYTESNTIALIVQKTKLASDEGRTGLPSEVSWFNKYTPRRINHCDAAWLPNNWHEETLFRDPDPPHVTIGATKTTLPPLDFRPFGPNPNFRKAPFVKDQ
jgi:SAM-dependent methyltransferase